MKCHLALKQNKKGHEWEHIGRIWRLKKYWKYQFETMNKQICIWVNKR